MNGPLLILILGGLLALLAYLLRARRAIAFGLAAGGSALLGGVAVGLVLGSPIQILSIGLKLEPEWLVLGRSFVLGESNRLSVGFIFLTGSVLLVAGMVSGAPRRLPAAGIGVMAALAAALMVQPFVFSPALIAAAAITASVTLGRPDGASGRAPARLLVAYTLAMMVMLLAGWLVEVGGVEGLAEIPTRPASLLLVVGLAIVIVAPPFHTWLTAAGEESHPLAFGFAAILFQSAGLVLLLRSLDAYAWMRTDPLVTEFLRGAGLLMIVLGSLWCLAERRAGRLVAYALIVDFGVSLLAVANLSVEGYTVALGMLVARALAVVVVSLGISGLGGRTGADGMESSAGYHRAALVGAMAGGLSLAGFPLTAGFPGRWQTLLLEAGADSVSAIAISLSVAAVSLAFARWGRDVLAGGEPASTGLRDGARFLLWAGTAFILILGLASAAPLAWGTAALAGYPGLTLPLSP